MNTTVFFSSKTDKWATPQYLFDELDEEFGFTLDACADQSNHKCARYYTEADNGLAQDWGGEVVFCNPPYGRNIGEWVKKCSEEARKPKTVVVALIPARTDTRYFHEFVYKQPDVEVRFLRGRIKFGESKKGAPFPSMVVVFGGHKP